MSTAEKHYFSLLRAALWSTPVDIREAIDWEAVMRIAEHHGNNVLLSDVALRLEKVNGPSPQLAARMQSGMRANLFGQMQLKRILVSAVKLLREHHIEPVLLKGFGLASLYPNPGLRQFGDIDIFVGLSDFHPACAALRTMQGSYTWGEEVDEGRHFNIEFGPYPMEVHRISAEVEDPKQRQVYDGIEREGLMETPQQMILEGFPLTIPSKDFVVFFTFFHAWHHFLTTGVGWRQLSDVAMALHAYHDQLDLDKLRRWLVSMQVMQPWQAFGWLMVAHLGLPEAEMPFYNPSCRPVAQKLYSRIMLEGNFRRPNRYKHAKPKGHIAKKIHSFIGIFVDFFQLASVFPKQAFSEMAIRLKTSFSKNFQKKMNFIREV